MWERIICNTKIFFFLNLNILGLTIIQVCNAQEPNRKNILPNLLARNLSCKLRQRICCSICTSIIIEVSNSRVSFNQIPWFLEDHSVWAPHQLYLYSTYIYFCLFFYKCSKNCLYSTYINYEWILFELNSVSNQLSSTIIFRK